MIVLYYFRLSKSYPFSNLSLGFILKVFFKFRKFQPRYSCKIYSYRKVECNEQTNLCKPSRFRAILSIKHMICHFIDCRYVTEHYLTIDVSGMFLF